MSRDMVSNPGEQKGSSREHRFGALIERGSDAIALFDPDGAIIYASPSTPHVVGFTPEELRHFNALDLIHPDDKALLAQRMSQLVKDPGGAPQ